MAEKNKDTVTYDLKRGNEVVYRGTTNDPARREREHKEEGKNFTHMRVTSKPMTEQGAMRKEAEQLKTYRKSHHGQNPEYNEDNDG